MAPPSRKRSSVSLELGSLALNADSPSDEELELDLTTEQRLERLHNQLKRVKKDVKDNATNSKQAPEYISKVEDRVERNERNSSAMNLNIQGYVKNAASEAHRQAVGNRHEHDQQDPLALCEKTHKVKGGSFIVRFDRQLSIETIYSNLHKLRDYKVQLPDGTKNYGSVKRDQTKAQKDQEAVANHARSILKKKGTDTKVRSDGRGYYLLTEDKQKQYSDSTLVREALENAVKKQTEND